MASEASSKSSTQLCFSCWDRVAYCESTNRWHIVTVVPGDVFYGGLQFTEETWKAYGGRKYATNAHLATRVQQILVADKVRRESGLHHWPKCGHRF